MTSMQPEQFDIPENLPLPAQEADEQNRTEPENAGDTPETAEKKDAVRERGELHPAANVNRIIKAGMIALLISFGGLGTWAAVAPLAGSIMGQGVVKVDFNRKTVQHLEGGIIKEIRVRDGDHVNKGDVLIVVSDARVDASVSILMNQLDEETAKAARLEAERSEADEVVFPDSLTGRSNDPEVAELMKRELLLFKSRHTNLMQSISLSEQMKVEIQQEIESFQAQIEGVKEAMKLLNEEIASNEALEKSQFIQKTTILGLKRALEDYRVRKGNLESELYRAKQKKTDADLRIVQLRNNYEERAAQELTGAYSTGVYETISSLKERLQPSEDQKRRQEITAPITGTVIGLNVFTVGGVIAPRQPLLDIVPDNNPLIVEARIGVDDIDEIHQGQEADVRLSAYRRRSTPLVLGKLVFVSADRMTDERTGAAYYLTHVQLDQKSLAEAGDLNPYPGMPAEVYIRTGERTALEYLTAPIRATLRRSMNEP